MSVDGCRRRSWYYSRRVNIYRWALDYNRGIPRAANLEWIFQPRARDKRLVCLFRTLVTSSLQLPMGIGTRGPRRAVRRASGEVPNPRETRKPQHTAVRDSWRGMLKQTLVRIALDESPELLRRNVRSSGERNNAEIGSQRFGGKNMSDVSQWKERDTCFFMYYFSLHHPSLDFCVLQLP